MADAILDRPPVIPLILADVGNVGASLVRVAGALQQGAAWQHRRDDGGNARRQRDELSALSIAGSVVTPLSG